MPKDLSSLTLYLNEINKVPLLTKEEEEQASIETLINHNLRLVVSIAKKYQNWSSMSLEDLIQEGNLGLICAAQKFEAAKGNRFSTHATWWIRHYITRAISNKGKTIRIPVNIQEVSDKIKKITQNGEVLTNEELSQKLDIPIDKIELALDAATVSTSLDATFDDDDEHGSLGELIADSRITNPLDELIAEENREKIEFILDTLEQKESFVISHRFGVETGEPETLEQIGQQLSLSRERVRQIEDKALRKLRQPFRAKLLKQYLAT